MKPMKFSTLVTSLLIFILAACTGGEQSTEYTIGVIYFADSMEVSLEGFRDGMADFGYVEGENVTYVYKKTANNSDMLLEAALDLVEQKVDLIVSLATPATQAAKQATADTDIPVLFLPINDPVIVGLVDSLSSTGNNLTGIRVGGFIPKQMEWLHRIAPDVQTIFYPYNPNDDSSLLGFEQVTQSAEMLGLTVITPQATTPEEVLDAFNSVPEEVDALFIAGDAMILSQVEEIIRISKEKNLPLATFILQHVEDGALFSYGFEFYPVGVQAARLGMELLKGVVPQNLPVETADFVLSVNLATADELDLSISDDILRQATNITRE